MSVDGDFRVNGKIRRVEQDTRLAVQIPWLANEKPSAGLFDQQLLLPQ